MLKNLLLPFLLLSISFAATATEMEIIPLNHRPAEEITPIIRPLLEGSEQVIANRSNLIVKATAARLKELKKLIKQLDAPQNNLTITVLQSRTKTAEQLNAELNIRLHSRRRDSSRFSADIRGRFGQTEGLNKSDSTQVVNTLEGRSAYIKTGTVHPVQDIHINNSGYGYPSVSTNTQFIEASTGFLVTPRLTGNHVILEVSPWSDRLNNNRTFDTQSANTTIRVKLGEWVEIGGISESSQTREDGTLYRAHSTADNNSRILIKVEKNQLSTTDTNPASFSKKPKWNSKQYQ